MIFSIRNLGFELGSLLLEGWAAFAARVVCAALLLSAWLAGAAAFVPQGVPCPAAPQLAAGRYAHSAAQLLPVPLQRLTLAAFIYAAAASLPWAIAGVNKFLLTVFELAATFFVCQGLYAAADLTDLLLASCGEEVRTNRTLTTLLNKVYKVLIVVLGVMTMAQESGLPVGSIVASAGLVGLTISLAAQDSAKNLFSGLVILLDRPFSIGDWITVGDVSGEVVDINFRSTKVRALDNSVYILTNSTVSSATINNGTLRNKRLYRFTLGVTYDTSVLSWNS
ncbi:MAG: mechanosensitive ion channel family protein [Faecalibacterium prausnitzii]